MPMPKRALKALDFSGTILGVRFCKVELVRHAFRALRQPEMYLKSSRAAPAMATLRVSVEEKELATALAFGICDMDCNPTRQCKVTRP